MSENEDSKGKLSSKVKFSLVILTIFEFPAKKQKQNFFKMARFQQFETGKISNFAKFDKQKCLFERKMTCPLGGKIQMWLK